MRSIQWTTSRPTGLTMWLTVMFLIFVVLPATCIQKAIHKGRTTLVSFQLQEDDIAFIALEEGNWTGIDATGCKGHLSPDPVAVMDQGRRSLYAVQPGYSLPKPWITPKWVWVRNYTDGDVSYLAVYDVFRTPLQVRQWADRHGYNGEFEFSLKKVLKDKPIEGGHFAVANSPHYYKGNSSIDTVIYTRGARYAVLGYEVYESNPEDETFQIYEGIAE